MQISTPGPGYPRASLGRVLDHLGTTLLDVAAGDPAAVPDIGGVVIHDPLDAPTLPTGALVLGVGVRGGEQIGGLLEQIGREGAAGLIVRSPVTVDDQLREVVARTGTVLLGLTRGASWNQLAALLRTLLGEGDLARTEPETIGGVPAGDLFTLANAVSALLDAPITIEDRSSRVLAFSERQGEADESRVQTILGRQVPERYTKQLEQQGYFRKLYRDEGALFIAADVFGLPGVTLARQAIAVRAGDEILGSIWAAVHEPLPPARARAFAEAAKLVALHLLRMRAGADAEWRLRNDLVATVLEGGPAAAEAAGRLGLAGRRCLVVALGPMQGPPIEGALELARWEAERQHTRDALTVHLSAMRHGSVVALLGGVVYAILPADVMSRAGNPGVESATGAAGAAGATTRAGKARAVAKAGAAGSTAAGGMGSVGAARAVEEAEQRAAAALGEFLERTGGTDLVGVGRLAEDNGGLPRSREDADRVLRVLRRRRTTRRIARLSDVHAEALLLDLADAEGRALSGPVDRLAAYDLEHRTGLVETLSAWLDAFGDVIAAAETVHVHPNTFRYRLNRIAEVGEVDLGDGESRFALMLQLRLLDAHKPREADGT